MHIFHRFLVKYLTFAREEVLSLHSAMKDPILHQECARPIESWDLQHTSPPLYCFLRKFAMNGVRQDPLKTLLANERKKRTAFFFAKRGRTKTACGYFYGKTGIAWIFFQPQKRRVLAYVSISFINRVLGAFY
jgi:hypothetical protein